MSGIIRAQQVVPLSDERAKCTIRAPDHDALSIIQTIKIYRYTFNSSLEGRQLQGPLAQQLAKAGPSLDRGGVASMPVSAALSQASNGAVAKLTTANVSGPWQFDKMLQQSTATTEPTSAAGCHPDPSEGSQAPLPAFKDTKETSRPEDKVGGTINRSDIPSPPFSDQASGKKGPYILSQQSGYTSHATVQKLRSLSRVECFASYTQMTAAKWPAAVEACDVLVMTPQSLVNMLEAGVVDFDNIDLLEHAYNKILKRSKGQQAKVQILGLTGSPGGRASPVGFCVSIDMNAISVCCKPQSTR
ncbi:hypothetical protein ABBQ32_010263 [Trebouxia sp. C0010 RCD-2024]